MKNIWRAIRFIPEYRDRIVAVVVVGTVLGAIGAGTPYLYKKIVDVVSRLLNGAITHSEAITTLGVLLGIFLALRVALVVFGAVQDRQSDELWLQTVGTFRQRVFDNMTRMSIDYFERNRVGEIMDRFGAITSITQWLFSLTEGTLASILQVVFVIGVLCVKAPLVAVLMIAVTAFNLVVSSRTVRRSRPLRRGFMALVGRMTGLLAEMVGNMSTVRSFGGEQVVKRRYDDTQQEWRVVRADLQRLERRSSLTLNVVNSTATFGVVGAAAYGALHGSLSPGDVLLLLMLTQNLLTTLTPISRQLNQAAEVDASAERLLELLDIEAELPDAPGAIELHQLESVTFEHVTFRYPAQRNDALHDVSFELRRGGRLALVGLSGSGKSTIVKLLMRFYDPTSGRVLVNGRDLREYRQRSVRAHLGVVLQDVSLFNDSLSENIAFARPDAPRADIEAAARTAHADEFIRRLPSGYDTLVGERGIKLSGGERQRIAIARALLKNPDLIILDEATSALDSHSEHLVQQGLSNLVIGRTSIVIAHRLSTVLAADEILVLEGGVIAERGRHPALVAGKGLYARLFSMQSGLSNLTTVASNH
ncbi:MAG: ABC transporter ATP-binding protein [Gammaproteobacteria bacterium]